MILADNINLNSGMAAWQTFSLANIGPANIKAIFGVIRPGQMSSANGYEQIIYSTYDNTTAFLYTLIF